MEDVLHALGEGCWFQRGPGQPWATLSFYTAIDCHSSGIYTVILPSLSAKMTVSPWASPGACSSAWLGAASLHGAAALLVPTCECGGRQSDTPATSPGCRSVGGLTRRGAGRLGTGVSSSAARGRITVRWLGSDVSVIHCQM